MTGSAWVMLVVTWTVVIFFTARFFFKVLRTPILPERERQMSDGILEKDA